MAASDAEPVREPRSPWRWPGMIGDAAGVAAAALLALGFLCPARPAAGREPERLSFFLAGMGLIIGLSLVGMWLGRGPGRVLAFGVFGLSAVLTGWVAWQAGR